MSFSPHVGKDKHIASIAHSAKTTTLFRTFMQWKVLHCVIMKFRGRATLPALFAHGPSIGLPLCLIAPERENRIIRRNIGWRQSMNTHPMVGYGLPRSA